MNPEIEGGLHRLTPRESVVFRRVIHEGETLKSVADDYDFSRERVERFVRKAARKIARGCDSPRLLAFGGIKDIRKWWKSITITDLSVTWISEPLDEERKTEEQEGTARDGLPRVGSNGGSLDSKAEGNDPGDEGGTEGEGPAIGTVSSLRRCSRCGWSGRGKFGDSCPRCGGRQCRCTFCLEHRDAIPDR